MAHTAFDIRSDIFFLRRRTLTRRFTVVSVVAVVCTTVAIGLWIANKITSSVLRLVTTTTALYVDSIIQPHLQELGASSAISAQHATSLDQLLRTTAFGKSIITVKVWSPTGQIVYSNNASLIGRRYPISPDLTRALNGDTAANLSDLDEDENSAEHSQYAELLEVYCPVFKEGTNQAIAVVEFYLLPGETRAEIDANQRQIGLIIGGSLLGIVALLFGFVRRSDGIIVQQHELLTRQVNQQGNLLNQNLYLHQRVRNAGATATELNEKTLWRLGSDLHDGPAQQISTALMRLDYVQAYFDDQAHASNASKEMVGYHNDVDVIHYSLCQALDEIRSISTTSALPNVSQLDLHDALTRVAQNHEWQSRTTVELVEENVPTDVSPAVKIALCRIIREALNNAYRHGKGLQQRVIITSDATSLHATISDSGPGFNTSTMAHLQGHLGILGMQYRVEILGGELQIKSEIGRGTTVFAKLPLTKPSETL